MKKNIIFVFVCLVIVFSFSTANAEYLGSMEPVSSGPLWKVSMGLGYQYYSDKIEIGSTSYTLNQNQVFLELSATVRNIEGYIRVGGADLQVNDIFNPNIYGGKSDFKDDTFKAFLTAGGRGSIPISPNFSINPFLQATFYPDYNDHADGTIGGLPVRQELEFSFYKVETGLLLQANLKPVTFYIGPIFYWIRGDVNKTEFEEKGNIGGAAGIKLSLGGNFSIGIEAQYRQEFSAGGMINYSF
jgi:hypothetical protein